MARIDGRNNDELRPIKFTCDFVENADGSVLVEFGKTKILVTASIADKVPPFLKDSGEGWITAEYSLLPGSTSPRAQREVNKGKPTGRTNEIQRLIGRSIRAAFDLSKLGERTIHIDADVLNADASTRCASICGAYIAVYNALQKVKSEGRIKEIPLISPVAAVSVGIVKGEVLSDLCYEEDSTAEVDANIVMNKDGEIIELQMTSERKPFGKSKIDDLVNIAQKGIDEIVEKQLAACKDLAKV